MTWPVLGSQSWPNVLLTYMYFCCGGACKYFGAYGTRTRVVHVMGFEEGPKF